MKLSLILVLFVFSQLSFGKILPKRPEVAPTQASVKKLRRLIKGQKRLVSKLGREITGLEKNLGQGNKRYIQVIEKRKKVEERIFKARRQIQAGEERLKQHHLEARKVLTSAVLNSFKDNQKPAEMLGHKILLKSLKIKITNLENDLLDNKNLIVRLEDLEKRVQEYSQVERELSTLLSEMEYKKKRVAATYLNERKERDRLQRSYDASKVLKMKTVKKKSLAPILVSLRFRAPLNEYAGLEYNKKGVTFKFEGRRPIYPTHGGKIDYVGTLSNYGNVIMINHGDDTRSVIFGQFNPKAKKGQTVSVGQIIGYTDDSASNGITSGKIYFEVRKRNKAQNTIRLMDKEWLAKNNLTSSRS